MMTPHHKIPSWAKPVFSWIRSEIYQWDQEMYDGSFSPFECIRFQDWAFVVPILPDGNILMTLQEQPGKSEFYSLPGWWVSTPDEDPLICAQREFLEETGYVSDEWELWFRYDGTANVMTYTYYYIARNCQYQQSIRQDPGEKIKLVEMTFDEFLMLSSDPRFQRNIKLVPLLYEARLDPERKKSLKKTFYGV
jgi:ADP-ribose pyrophosphatase